MRHPKTISLLCLLITALVIGFLLRDSPNRDRTDSAEIRTAPADEPVGDRDDRTPAGPAIRNTEGDAGSAVLSRVDLPPQDHAALREKARKRDGGGVFRFATAIPTDLNPKNSGKWREAGEGRRIWRLQIRSEGAQSLNLGFSQYRMPKGGRFWIFGPSDESRRPVRAFTEADNEPHGQLWTPLIIGEEIVLEVEVPAEREAGLKLQLASVNHGFRGLPDKSGKIGGESSGSCNIDTICNASTLPGIGTFVDTYRDQIRSVGAYTLFGTDTCTGALVNNTARDGKPYFLTANHCEVGSGSAPSMVVYWNFENSTCRTPGSPDSGGVGDGDLTQFNTGAIFRAGYGRSDFTLVELDDPIDPAANPYFAGWDRRGVAATSAAGIHHPAVAEKRISFEFNRTTTTSYLKNKVPGNRTHIRVKDWDHGTTEGGSSGSPLFDQNRRIIGQLHGGHADCGNNQSDWYGRLSVSWAGGGTNSTRLRNWLDPDSTGVNTLNGQYGDELLAIDDVTVAEGDAGTVAAVFTVTLNRAPDEQVRVDYATANGTAITPGDYLSKSGALVFPPGVTTRTVSIDVKGDAAVEEDETFRVILSNPVNAVIGVAEGTGTIETDDYNAPDITGSLTAIGAESQPFAYTITASGTPRSFGLNGGIPSGMTVNPATGEISWTPAAPGNYPVGITATNPAGSDTETLVITVLENELKVAIDAPPSLTVTTGTPAWFLQTIENHDGIHAAQSAALLGDGQTSWMETVVTGPDAVIFWWKVSSESGFDLLDFAVDGATEFSISGEQDWEQVIFPIPAGTHTLRWEYAKDSSITEGADAGWVDEVSLGSTDPRPYITSPATALGQTGVPFAYQITTVSPATGFTQSGLPAGLNLDTGSGLISGTPASTGDSTVTLTATNGSGADDLTLNLNVIEALGPGVEMTLLDWDTGIDAPWESQTETTHDTVDANQSGMIGHDEESWMETSVAGPHTVKFWWKVSSEENFDKLRFEVDGIEQASIDGEVDWREETHVLEGGNHTLRWTYAKDGSVANGDDAGWVDEVRILLSAVTGLTVSDGSFEDRVALAWDASAGADTYEIRRGTTGDHAASAAIGNNAGTGFDDTTAVPGTIYYYWVQAVDSFGPGIAGAGIRGLRAPDIHGDTPETGSVLPLGPAGGASDGFMAFGDRDFFEITLTEESEVVIFTTGAVDTLGVLTDAAGNPLNDSGADDNAGGGGQFRIEETLAPGSYFIEVSGADGLQTGNFGLTVSLDPDAFQPDILPSNNVYSDSGAHQSSKLVSRKARRVKLVLTLQNDGALPDLFWVAGQKGNSIFEIKYRDATGNVTGAVVTGKYASALLTPRTEKQSLTFEVKPKRSRVRKKSARGPVIWRKKRFLSTVTATSNGNNAKTDRVSIQVQTR